MYQYGSTLRKGGDGVSNRNCNDQTYYVNGS